MKFLNVLTRSEMKKLSGGSMGCGGGECLVCMVPHGREEHCENPPDPQASCEVNHPQYHPSEIQGFIGQCD
jgi:hypothetical protein